VARMDPLSYWLVLGPFFGRNDFHPWSLLMVIIKHVPTVNIT
jgi:hypothetical protein